MREFGDVTVVVPVGPHCAYRDYLGECLQSIREQTVQPQEIIVVDDMAGLPAYSFPDCRIIKNDWLQGAADSWNRGVANAITNPVFLMGSDDKLMPTCLEECMAEYERQQKLDAWYNVTIELQNGETSWLFNNAAMVTKGLWNMTGGFPPSAFAGPDALLLSIMMVHMSKRMVQVKQGTPLYWCRQHPEQDTLRNAARFNQPTIDIRNIETRDWKPPFWTGYWENDSTH